MGFEASALEGGFDAWSAGYPTERVETEQMTGQGPAPAQT